MIPFPHIPSITISMTPLEVAITQIGKQEEPRGSNWGPSVQKYLKSVGISFPAAWCMSFVYWCFDESYNLIEHPNPLFKTGGVLAQWAHTPEANKRLVNPEPGDIFIMDFGKGLGHTGFVRAIDMNKKDIHTVEGNSNDEGSREGFEVCERIRSIQSIKGFIRF